MKNFLKKLFFLTFAGALLLFGAVATHADVTGNYWSLTGPGVLMTNAGNGLANADIHVANCYIGTGTGTPCGSGLTTVNHDGSLTGNGTSGSPLGVDTSWFDGRFNTDFALKTTDDLTEGVTNLYWTSGRFTTAFNAAFPGAFNTQLATKTTDDLAEGSLNLYFTDARALTANVGHWVGLTGDETIFGVKTFDDFPTKTGSLTPILSGDFTTKDYVDAFALGFRTKASVLAATKVALPAVTYNNGASGVGATLTANANGALPTIDTVTLSNGDRVLIKNQASALQNGIYVVTDSGDGSNPFILTRSTDLDDTATAVQGSATLVLQGSASTSPTFGNYATHWAIITPNPITVGVDDIVWTEISLQQSYFAGTGLILTGTTFSLAPGAAGPYSIANTTSIYSSGLTGTGTGNATGYNFFSGVSAGSSATNVDNGVFIGHSAGSGATNANNGIFLGQQAGFVATSAFDAVFIGNGSGFNAPFSSGGVFIGRDSGSGATNADGSVFIGSSSGGSASSASHAIGVGVSAGQNASQADNGIFIGESAGQNATNAYDSLCLGTNACKNDTVNNAFGSSSIAIGSAAGTGGFSNSIALGRNTQNTAANQFILGSSYTQAIFPGTTSFGIGVASPTALLHLAASAGTTPPLKFTSGSNTGTAQAGAEEYNGTSFFLTNSSAQRAEIPLIQQGRTIAAFNRTASTVLTNVTRLTANVVSGRTYQFEANLYTTSNNAGGVKAAIGGTATSSNIVYQAQTVNAATTLTSRGAAVGATVGAVTAVTAAYIHIEGTTTASSTGTITVQFGQNASNATASTVLIGSTFVVTQMP